MNYLYINNDNLDYWLQLARIQGPNIQITKNLEEWLSYPKSQCIALWETQNFGSDDLSMLEQILDHAVHALVFLPEFIDDAWIKSHDVSNVTYFIGGTLNWTPQQAQVKFHRYFFWSTTDFYKTHPSWIDVVSNRYPKPYKFDVLLGRRKPHRTHIWQQINQKDNIVTYFEHDNDSDLRNLDTERFQWPAEILPKPDHPVSWTGDEVTVNGTIVSLSQLIPVDIYNKTAYSIVAETAYDNGFSFFTEKIIKPIMCCRLFMVAAGQYYLHNLRLLGFKTFDNIVNENYDKEPSLHRRVDLMLDQIGWLSYQDQDKIYSRIKDRVEYNQKLVMGKNWLQDMVNDIGSVIKPLLLTDAN